MGLSKEQWICQMRLAICCVKLEKPQLLRLRFLLFTVCFLFYGSCIAADKVFVGVASSMRLAWPDWIAAAEVPNSGLLAVNVSSSFSSSGNLARQIQQGAPLDLFVSASQKYVDILQKQEGRVVQSAAFVSGELAIVVLKKGKFANTTDQTMLDALLSAKPEAFESLSPLRISLANSRHAPYGIAADQILKNLDPNNAHQRLFAENASQAVQFLTTGGADVAIVPVSLLVSRPADFLWQQLDRHLYNPVVHHLVLLRGASAGAAELYESLLQVQALQALQSFGFKAIAAIDAAK